MKGTLPTNGAVEEPDLLHIQSPDEHQANAAAQGLRSAEAQRLLEKYGANEIPEKEETTLRRILKRFWGPIPWMIEIAAILSAAVGKWEDFIIITLLLLVNVIVDFSQERKAL